MRFENNKDPPLISPLLPTYYVSERKGELALKGGVQTQSHFMYLRMYAAGCKIFNGVQWTRASRPISEVLSENFAPDSFWRPRGGSGGLLFWRRGPRRLAASAVRKRRREALNMRFILFPAYAAEAVARDGCGSCINCSDPKLKKKFGCMVTPRKKRPKRNESEALAVGDQDCGSLGAEQRRYWIG
jgi:hypothetical protein